MRVMLAALVWIVACSRVTAGLEPVPSTSTPTPLPCVGDCPQHGAVTTQDLITVVSIILGDVPVTECDVGGDPEAWIDVVELIAAVNSALDGCYPTPVVTPTPTFTPPPCGDGHIEPPEQCDDGNTANGDGCNANCQVEPMWRCDNEPSFCVFIPCGAPVLTCSGGPTPPTPTPTPLR